MAQSKKPLPSKIEKIGLITSKQSDALHDFEDTYRSEKGTASIRLSDVRLQGQQAVREITDAINHLNNESSIDVIVIIRGGGRAADLAVFYDYLIAEAICRSTIPVVTGLGHQRDSTFADQVADASSITPTAAALLVARANQQSAPPERSSTKSNQSIYLFTGLLISIGILIGVFLLLSR